MFGTFGAFLVGEIKDGKPEYYPYGRATTFEASKVSRMHQYGYHIQDRENVPCGVEP
jgi:hypothetical protein